MRDYLIIVVVCGLASYLLVPITIKIAEHIKAISIPHSRHIHTQPMPLLGGLAIFISFLFGFLIFAEPYNYSIRVVSYEIPSILIASIIILLLGIVDDIKPLRARTKFFVQVLVALVIVFFGKLKIDNTFEFLPDSIESIFGIVLTIFWIISVINAINLVDGLNGLSSGVSVIYFATVLALYFLGGIATQFALLIAATMLGATLGYLPWNFPNAKVFMGDAGSMFLGLMIAIVPLLGFKQITLVSLFLPMLMMVVPVFEIFSTIIRRTINNQSIGTADNNHIHHQLLRVTNSPTKAVIIIWTISILFSINSIILELGNTTIGIIIFIILAIFSIGLLQLSKEFNNYDSFARKLLNKRKKNK